MRKECAPTTLQDQETQTAMQQAITKESVQLKRATTSRVGGLLLVDLVTFTISSLLALATAMAIRVQLTGKLGPPVADDALRIAIVFGVALVILLFRSWTLGHYTQFRPFWKELQDIAKTVMLIAAFDAFLLFAIGVQFSRLWFGFFLIYACVLLPAGREQAKLWMIKQGIWYRPTYIVGTGTNACKTALALQSDTSLGHEVLGFISNSKITELQQLQGKPVLSNPLQAQALNNQNITLVFALDTMEAMDQHMELMNHTLATSEQITIVTPDIGLPLYGASVVGIFRHDTALLKVQNRLANPTAQWMKRASDVILSCLFLTLLLPVFILLGLLIRRDGGPIFFKHQRIGRDGKHFNCLKFRSMQIDADRMLSEHLKNNQQARENWQSKRKLADDPRITSMGQFLRRTSLDELPQLLNVIKGEMSLVGPRPIVAEEVAFFKGFTSYYTTMRPGITGLWQVSGRTDTSYSERVKLDVWYCRNWSLWNDVVVLIKTIKSVIKQHGAY